MKLTIDPQLCVGHGRCYEVAPELIAYNDEGYPAVQGEPIDVGPEHKSAARAAAANCPEVAIKLSLQ